MKHVATTVLIIAAVLVSTVQGAEAHSTGEIRQAAQTWVDAGAPYDRLTTGSQQLVDAGVWQSWKRCGADPEEMTATVRGHGNDLAVVRFTGPTGRYTEWTAFYTAGAWRFELNSAAVHLIRTHTAWQLEHCQD